MASDIFSVPVTKIQRFSTHDGPGIRTTVFFKGCPLRCKWCHNPETQSALNQIFFTPGFCIGCGACAQVCAFGAHRITEQEHHFDASLCRGCLKCADVCPSKGCESCAQIMSIPELLAALEKDRPFFRHNGGLTLSGGEPMAHPKAACALLEDAHSRGYHTAIETCGYFPSEFVDRLAVCTDLFLYDFKDSNDERHMKNTGVSNQLILKNLRLLNERHVHLRLRCIMIRTVNMEEAHYNAIAELAASLSSCEGVDLLPYHPFGSSKAVQLGLPENGRTDWIPTPEDMQLARDTLNKLGILSVSCE